MKRTTLPMTIGLGLILVGVIPTPSLPSNPLLDGIDPDGWFFQGTKRADAEAKVLGANGTRLVVDCNDAAPRVMIFFLNNRLAPDLSGLDPSLKPVTKSRDLALTFRFLKRGIASQLTSYFDKDEIREFLGQEFSTGPRGGPTTTIHVNFDGAPATALVDKLKTMDRVSAGTPSLGQPLTFELDGAQPVIDRVLPICASGP
jgi:hypothetical protein